MARALIDCYERSEPQRGHYLKRLEREWLCKYPNLPQTSQTLACQAKMNLAGDGVLQVTDSPDLDLVNDARIGASRRRRVQEVILNLQRDNILMELYRESKPMEKAYAKQLYQAWTAAIPNHKTTKVALTARVGRIRRGQVLSSSRTSSNDQLMLLLGKAKDACLQKKHGDFSDRKPCGVVRFNHVYTALLQEVNNWVEKEWQEGPRSAWLLNCLVYSVAMAVRGKQPINRSHATREGNGTIRRLVRNRRSHK